MKQLFKFFGWIFTAVMALVALAVAYLAGLYCSADVTEPEGACRGAVHRVVTFPDGHSEFGDNMLRHSRNGFWELSLNGGAEERGAAFGALCDSLLDYQERIFIDQIHRIVPNDRYLRFLNIVTQIFNRRITHHIPEEYCREIAAMSRYCTHEYDFFGTPYLRQLNYHAAHDIGHAMQDYMLVGCTAVGAWGKASDEGLVVGRNFDFWVGDDFAANRLITFCSPESGHPFVSIGWAGMVGVLSGMNAEGLCITLHAAKGDLPLRSATPVSILAREILQYAATIDEAVAIASRAKLFVSECFLVGSARDGRCVVIEKTPEQQDIYAPEGEVLCLSNHFRSEGLAQSPLNCDNIASSDSRFRLERIEDLARKAQPLTTRKVVGILRDRKLSDSVDLGLSNPMAINQQIAHHSVVFEPNRLRMWLSTDAWGYGEWVAYDVGAVLRGEKPFVAELAEDEVIEADRDFLVKDLPRLVRYRQILRSPSVATIDSLPILNPEAWESHVAQGDFYRKSGDKERARICYRDALQRPMPEGEKFNVEHKLNAIK